MNFSKKLQQAVVFAEKVHRTQKRKGSNAPYIIHPLCVTFILSRTSADDNLLCGALLHDTVEDCDVSFEEIESHFGETVRKIVEEVTEEDTKTTSWEIRKRRAEERIKKMSNDALLLKSADMIHNISDLLIDLEKRGEDAFLKFSAPKEEKMSHLSRLIFNMEKAWPENPLLREVKKNFDEIKKRSIN